MFLILIGGLLILFVYMRRIASNEKFTTNILLIIIPLIILIIPIERILTEILTNESITTILTADAVSMIKIYNKKTFMVTIFMFLYLLLSIIVVTKIIKIFKGPLRSK